MKMGWAERLTSMIPQSARTMQLEREKTTKNVTVNKTEPFISLPIAILSLLSAFFLLTVLC
jgi:hypothetical protein